MTEIISFLIHGSIVRSKIDEYSDRDCVIISNEPIENIGLYHKLKDRNWSCSIYSTNKFSHLTKTKSLFVKHLKDESVVIFDKENFFGNLIQSYTPKDNYKDELDENFEILKHFLTIPKLPDYKFFLDVFYVVFRNALIFIQNPTTVNFSYQECIQMLHLQNKISKEELDELSSLRVCKYLYRTNISDEATNNKYTPDYLKSLLNTFNRIFSLNHSISTIDKETAQKVYNKLAFSPSNSSYIRLRAFEYLFNFHRASLIEQGIPVELLAKAIAEPANFKRSFFTQIDFAYNADFFFSY